MVSPPNGPRHALKVYGTAETMTCEMERNSSRWNRWNVPQGGLSPCSAVSYETSEQYATSCGVTNSESRCQGGFDSLQAL